MLIMHWGVLVVLLIWRMGKRLIWILSLMGRRMMLVPLPFSILHPVTRKVWNHPQRATAGICRLQALVRGRVAREVVEAMREELEEVSID